MPTLTLSTNLWQLLSWANCSSNQSRCGAKVLQWRIPGGGGGGQKGQLPPLFQGERVGGRAVCHVVTIEDEQTQRGTGHGERKIPMGELFLLTRAPPRTAMLL